MRAHQDPDEFPAGSDDWLDALGNQFADTYAKIGAASHPSPSTAELAAYFREYEVITRFLRYVGLALMLWPAVSPNTGCKVALGKLSSKPDPVVGASGRSFASDVLGPWILQRTQSPIQSPTVSHLSAAPAAVDLDLSPFPPSQTQGVEPAAPLQKEGGRDLQAGSGATTTAAEPPPTGDLPPSRRRLAGKQGVPLKTELHNWRFKKDKWLCINCLSTTRKAQPDRRAKCLGYAPSLRELVADPRGHALMVSFFSDSAGMVVLCARCGAHSTSNRKCKKLHDTCKGKSLSAGAGACHERLKALMHPKHEKGDAKVLEPWVPLASLIAQSASAGSSQGSTH